MTCCVRVRENVFACVRAYMPKSGVACVQEELEREENRRVEEAQKKNEAARKKAPKTARKKASKEATARKKAEKRKLREKAKKILEEMKDTLRHFVCPNTSCRVLISHVQTWTAAKEEDGSNSAEVPMGLGGKSEGGDGGAAAKEERVMSVEEAGVSYAMANETGKSYEVHAGFNTFLPEGYKMEVPNPQVPEHCPACGSKLPPEMFACCHKEDELSSDLERALGQDGLRVFLPKNAEAVLHGVRGHREQRIYGKGAAAGASSHLLRHVIRSRHLSETLLGCLLSAEFRLKLLKERIELLGSKVQDDKQEDLTREILMEFTDSLKQSRNVQRVTDLVVPPVKLALCGQLKHQAQCVGIYSLVPQREANGWPVWKHTSQDRWIVRDDGKWLVQEEKNMGKNRNSHVQVVDNSEMYPHATSKQWMEWGSISAEQKDWVPAPSLKCFSDPVPPAKLALCGQFWL